VSFFGRGFLFFEDDMIEYELFYLVGESKELQKDEIAKAIEGVVTRHGGTFLPPMTEEKRKMAYEVKGEIRGTYVARRFTLPDRDELDAQGVAEDAAHPLSEINRELMLSKDILRFLLLRADDLPELKPIPRVEKKPTERRGGRYERRGTTKALREAPVTNIAEEKKATSEEIDKQLKQKLDI
jgi:ribosomal protein S6